MVPTSSHAVIFLRYGYKFYGSRDKPIVGPYNRITTKQSWVNLGQPRVI